MLVSEEFASQNWKIKVFCEFKIGFEYFVIYRQKT